MVYGYIRVSTENQTTENQRLVITKWAEGNNIIIDDWISETISGIKRPTERKLGNLLSKLNPGDKLIVTELSRLGRSLIMIFNILQQLLDRGIELYAVKENFKLADDIQSKVLAFAFGLSAEIERQLIVERTNAGLARAKAQGKRIGRKKGRLSSKVKLDKYKKKISDLYQQGVSINSLAHLYKVRWTTMQSYLKRIKIYKKDRPAEKSINMFDESIVDI